MSQTALQPQTRVTPDNSHDPEATDLGCQRMGDIIPCTRSFAIPLSLTTAMNACAMQSP